jgi:hypothetical protein
MSTITGASRIETSWWHTVGNVRKKRFAESTRADARSKRQRHDLSPRGPNGQRCHNLASQSGNRNSHTNPNQNT